MISFCKSPLLRFFSQPPCVSEPKGGRGHKLCGPTIPYHYFFQCPTLFITHILDQECTRWDLSHTFWTLGLPDGILSNRPCPSYVCLCVCLQTPLLVRESVHVSVFKYLGDHSFFFYNFGPWVYPMGSLVIALDSLLVRL